MIKTTVGYAGGAERNPTYRSMGDHTEAVEVIFDPAQISYKQLLEVFWDAHNPTTQAWQRQYRNALFYSGEKQRTGALLSQKQLQAKLPYTVETDIEALGTFYPAEDYHQKYRLRNNSKLFAELLKRYGSEEAVLDSTVAARINGYLGGHGSRESFKRNLGLLGLTSSGQKRLKDAVGTRL